MKTNFHSHTYLCGHASGYPEEYIEAAISEGFSRYGVSDHGFLSDFMISKKKEYPWLTFQMSREDFYNRYLPDLERAIERYHDKVEIYKGLEVEYVPNQDEYYHELLSNLDYLILGVHYVVSGDMVMGTRGLKSKKELDIYVDACIEGMKTGYFTYLAHPDVFMFGYPSFDLNVEECARRIAEASIKYNCPLEINCGGIYKGLKENSPFKYYPNIDFWKVISEYKDVKVVVGIDCHQVSEVYGDGYNIACSLLDELHIKKYDISKNDLKNVFK